MNEKKIEDRTQEFSADHQTDEEESDPTAEQEDVCLKAPEWAEHSRLHDEDEPCDDGRSGDLERNRQDD
jgi:hypothetical protein